jgi:hypothetical protein
MLSGVQPSLHGASLSPAASKSKRKHCALPKLAALECHLPYRLPAVSPLRQHQVARTARRPPAPSEDSKFVAIDLAIFQN